MIELENKRVYNFIVDKDALVNEGRKISQQIENMELRIKRYEDREKKITAKIIPPKEWTDRGEAIVKEIEKLSIELDALAMKINNEKLEAVPADIKTDHLKLLKDKEILERERNKIALKVQKIKDRLIPIIQKEVKPLLGKYDDIETAKAINGKVVISTFNYVEDYKKKLDR